MEVGRPAVLSDMLPEPLVRWMGPRLRPLPD